MENRGQKAALVMWDRGGEQETHGNMAGNNTHPVYVSGDSVAAVTKKWRLRGYTAVSART
ncbi:hypothetical protein ASPCAL13217 [Aspergillus calidoustus]|uniref:Uncharacterized protein n=1 Tax=Aspergillus calidoustus TaxID=454130 RepID=A0A0U5CH57_ASPCI|nr:hypothetical protein ASPCAL13217 [Aspergillus calidoustus]